MKCLCPVSGRHYYSDDLFHNENEIPHPHPIFSLSTRSLLARARKWGKGSYTIEEEKLLFLALLNKTNSVTWEVPADPSPSTVKKYMEPLFKLIIWYSEVSSDALKLPQLRVSSYHRDLSNIGAFISSIYEVRKEWKEPTLRRIHDQVLELREQRLYKAIHSKKSTEEYTNQLADYAVIAAQFPEDKIDYWTSIIRTPLDHSIFSLNADEISLMINWIHKHIPIGTGSIHALKLIEHVNKLYSIQKEGMLTYLGGELKSDPRSTFRIKLDDMDEDDRDQQVASVKELEDKLATLNAPTTEPISSRYPNSIAWARDKIKWTQAQKLKEDIEYARTKGL